MATKAFEPAKQINAKVGDRLRFTYYLRQPGGQLQELSSDRPGVGLTFRVAKILPHPFLTSAMRALPLALVFVAMFYWLWRVRGRRLNRSAAGTASAVG